MGGRVAHRGGHLPPGPLIVRRILSLGEHPASSVCTSHTKSSKVSDMQEAAQTCCWVDGLLCHMARPLGVRGPAILSARYFTESRTRVNALMPLAALLGFAERVVLPAQGQALNSWRPLSRFLHAAGGHWALLTHPLHPWRPASLLRVLSPALQEAVAGLTLVSPGPSQMSWRPQYRSSKFRNVYGKVANREHCFDGIPITKNVHDNHFCAVNARFLAIVTESAGGGSFLVIPLEQVGAPQLPSPRCSPRVERSPVWSPLGLLPLFLSASFFLLSHHVSSSCAFPRVFLEVTRTSTGQDPRDLVLFPELPELEQITCFGVHGVPMNPEGSHHLISKVRSSFTIPCPGCPFGLELEGIKSQHRHARHLQKWHTC